MSSFIINFQKLVHVCLLPTLFYASSHETHLDDTLICVSFRRTDRSYWWPMNARHVHGGCWSGAADYGLFSIIIIVASWRHDHALVGQREVMHAFKAHGRLLLRYYHVLRGSIFHIILFWSVLLRLAVIINTIAESSIRVLWPNRCRTFLKIEIWATFHNIFCNKMVTTC